MDWLTNWIFKEGPGISKDEPKKTGLPLLVSTIGREAWELFKLNLLMLLLAIPLVTIPASFAAASHITTRMLADEVVFFWRDFWRAFAHYFWRATAFGVAFGGLIALCGYAAYIYGQLALRELLFIAPAVLAICMTLFLMMVVICLFALMVKSDLSNERLVKAALIATLAQPLLLLAGLLFNGGLWLAHIIFYPASIFLPIVLNFSLGTLVMMFCATKATDFALGRFNSEKTGQDVKISASSQMQFQTEEKT